MHTLEQNIEKLGEDPEYAMEKLSDKLIPQLTKDTNMYDQLLTELEDSIETLAQGGEHVFEDVLLDLLEKLEDMKAKQYDE